MRARYLSLIAATAACLLACGPAAVAQDSTPEADISVRLSGTRIYFEASPDYFNYTVRVTGPNDYVGEVFSPRRPPSFRLGDYGAVADGIYRYEITAATQEVRQFASSRSPIENGRPASSQQPRVGVSTDGSFHVINGQILVSSETESES